MGMINAVVVGLGWWGRHIVGSLAESDRIKVVGVTARRPEQHRDFAEQTGAKLFPGLDAALTDDGVDAVILCTPHSQHEEQVLAALDAGKHVFCEKPLGLTKASVQKMMDRAQRANTILGVGHERRFEAPVEEITRQVTSGNIGIHMHAEANFSHNLLVNVDPDSWRGSLEEAPAAGMTGMGVHLTDLFLSMFGPVEKLCAQTARRVLNLPTGDLVAVQFQFKSGATAFIAAISATPYYGRFTVFGDRMWIEARDTAHPQNGGETLLVSCGADGKQNTQTFGPRNTVRANLHEWADAINGNGTYRFTESELIANVTILEAISKSANGGGWVTV